MFWRKKKAYVVTMYAIVEPPPLTGIEKEAIESARREEEAKQRAEQERRAKITARIAEIEQKIGPELKELKELRERLYPCLQLVNAYSHATQGVGAGLLGNLLGGPRF